jgi:hypothetical protein
MIGGSSPGRGWKFFLITTSSRPALGPTQPPIQWVPGTLSTAVKRPGREADHSPPPCTEFENAWSYTSTHNTSSWRGAHLSKEGLDRFGSPKFGMMDLNRTTGGYEEGIWAMNKPFRRAAIAQSV